MSSLTAALEKAATALGFSVESAALERLAAYADALLELNQRINLTAARTPEQMLDVLLLPSLGVAAAWTEAEPPKHILDVGSGNGFPGMAAAAIWPDARVTLVERRAKKARAIDTCIEASGLANARALACDAREVKNEDERLLAAMDLVTVRAVGPLDDTTALAFPFLAPGGRVVHWKGKNLTTAERGSGAEAARGLGLSVLPEVEQPAGRGLLVSYQRPGKSTA